MWPGPRQTALALTPAAVECVDWYVGGAGGQDPDVKVAAGPGDARLGAVVQGFRAGGGRWGGVGRGMVYGLVGGRQVGGQPECDTACAWKGVCMPTPTRASTPALPPPPARRHQSSYQLSIVFGSPPMSQSKPCSRVMGLASGHVRCPRQACRHAVITQQCGHKSLAPCPRPLALHQPPVAHSRACALHRRGRQNRQAVGLCGALHGTSGRAGHRRGRQPVAAAAWKGLRLLWLWPTSCMNAVMSQVCMGGM